MMSPDKNLQDLVFVSPSWTQPAMPTEFFFCLFLDFQDFFFFTGSHKNVDVFYSIVHIFEYLFQESSLVFSDFFAFLVSS